MTTDEEIADIERRLFGMSHGHIEYSMLNQRLIALRAEQKIEHDRSAEQSRKESECKWYRKPLGIIFLGASGAVIAAAFIYLLAAYLGIRL